MTHPSDCPHVTDPTLRAWYAENPTRMCARCALEGRTWLVAANGKARAFPPEDKPA